MRFFTKLWAYTKLGKFFDRGATTIVVGDVTLQTPTTGYTTADLTPDFNWTDATNATSYRIQIATDAGFVTIVETGTPATSNYTSSGLTAGQTYYWRARGENGTVYGSWSAAFTLKTLGTVTLDTPADASFTTDTTPTFTWNAATNATGYIAELATANTFGATIIETYTGANTTFTAATIAVDGWLYWRVRPTAEAGAEVGSNTATRTLELFNNRSGITFDAVNDLATIADAADFRFNEGAGGKAMSIMVDLIPTIAAGRAYGYLSKLNTGSATGREWSLHFNDSGGTYYLWFTIWGNSTGTILIQRRCSAGDFVSGTKYRVVVTYDGASTIKIYLNGTQKDAASANAGVWVSPYATNNSVNLGQTYASAGTRYGSCDMDELAIWETELTAANVTSLQNSGNERDARLVGSNLVGYWKFNENAGTSVNDETANNRDIAFAAAPATPTRKNTF